MKTIFFFFVCFYFCFFLILVKTSHLLSLLVSLEMAVLFLLMLMINSENLSDLMLLPIFFVSFSICESIVGLVLFIFMIRFYSKDYLSSLSLMKF
uniref:NADH-ubiquinone oxidoreductase chain 4L n=1 Tax=Thulinius sp. DVL-2010 TaxID=867920 RepID=F8RJB9_9BILA|nr:NADH dehydrogenase subunit 4L [Thulinius sp. DVL-2010]ADK97601.1 NADH dehydrogenase subunit 4L [Thulinius sp. DVL-2010]